ncbi:hypothetical protein [Acinetobacter larvae]|uniref:Immunity protein 52 domain-containing protein n=1 Tax=Acinetobacter larvae TaxID=1789224 RepID=A0A1B2LYD9_9GAMM|nr:hypothetical protein [Acinetobacter larvae]AOA57899.1 hypothetical protein BFG52_05725 [Acinetobacter larvae]
MPNFFLNSLFYKALSRSENDLDAQMQLLEKLIRGLQVINPVFNNWYVNNAKNSQPPLDLPFPSESADKYFKLLKKNNEFKPLLLWNGQINNDYYANIALQLIHLSISLNKTIQPSDLIKVFSVILEVFSVRYLYLSNNFNNEIRVFEHSYPVSSICYLPKILKDIAIPHLYKKIIIDNEVNKGTLLIFDENIYDESDEMKKKIQENTLALVELDLIPSTKLPDNFFEK